MSANTLRHNGSKLPPHQREKVLAFLRAGYSPSEINRETKVSRDTIIGLRESQIHVDDLRQAKEILAAKCDRIALKATDQLSDQLDGKEPLTPQQLVPVIGVMVEKSILLRTDPTIHVLHSHQHQHIHAHISPQSFDQVLAALPDEPNNTLPVPVLVESSEHNAKAGCESSGIGSNPTTDGEARESTQPNFETPLAKVSTKQDSRDGQSLSHEEPISAFILDNEKAEDAQGDQRAADT